MPRFVFRMLLNGHEDRVDPELSEQSGERESRWRAAIRTGSRDMGARQNRGSRR